MKGPVSEAENRVVGILAKERCKQVPKIHDTHKQERSEQALESDQVPALKARGTIDLGNFRKNGGFIDGLLNRSPGRL